MAKRRRVEWTAETRDDLLQVVDFIAFNPLTAQRILIACDRARSASIGSRSVDAWFRNCAAQDSGNTELVVTPWRMFYTIETDVVRVIALFDGRRDLRELLHDRFARASIRK